MLTFEEARKTHLVKRLAFGFANCEKWMDVFRKAGDKKLLDRQMDSCIRHDVQLWEATVNGIKVMWWDCYAGYGPSQLYVAVKDKAAYEQLKSCRLTK